MSHTIEDIAKINRESARAKTGIRIIELSSLGEVIPLAEAEGIRQQLLANKVPVKQLTNVSSFAGWTAVDGFVDQCMQVRHISEQELPIQTEVLIFDDTVAFYRVEPEVTLTVVTEAAVAAQQKALFDLAWQQAAPMALASDGSTIAS